MFISDLKKVVGFQFLSKRNSAIKYQFEAGNKDM